MAQLVLLLIIEECDSLVCCLSFEIMARVIQLIGVGLFIRLL